MAKLELGYRKKGTEKSVSTDQSEKSRKLRPTRTSRITLTARMVRIVKKISTAQQPVCRKVNAMKPTYPVKPDNAAIEHPAETGNPVKSVPPIKIVSTIETAYPVKPVSPAIEIIDPLKRVNTSETAYLVMADRPVKPALSIETVIPGKPVHAIQTVSIVKKTHPSHKTIQSTKTVRQHSALLWGLLCRSSIKNKKSSRKKKNKNTCLNEHSQKLQKNKSQKS